MRFTDKVCVVTGAGSGIGRATCRRFAAEGSKVVVVDLNEAHGNETMHLIQQAGGQAIFAKADVSISSQVQAAITLARETWGRIDVLVNNAAMMTSQPIVDLPDEDWDRVQAVNLRSIFLFCKYSLPHMPAGAAIVNVSSVHAHETTANVVPYAASKGAMEAFTRGLSVECEAAKIRVNAVAPGAVNTPMLWSNPNVQRGKEQIQGAIGEPEDLAAVIAFVASGEARFVNGATIVADGGRLDIL